MPIIGLIGGIAPPSTIDYYKLLIEKYRTKHDGSFPHLLINSIDLAAMLALVAANRLDELADFLVREIDRLARAGAEIAIITSNTTHIVYDRVQPRARIPLVSIVEATCDYVLGEGMRRVGLIGSRFVTLFLDRVLPLLKLATIACVRASPLMAADCCCDNAGPARTAIVRASASIES
jgi:aspartate racemase